MTATVRISDAAAIVLDPIQGDRSGHITRGVLLTLQGRTHGDTLNCAVIPLDKVRAVIASLELVAKQVAS